MHNKPLLLKRILKKIINSFNKCLVKDGPSSIEYIKKMLVSHFFENLILWGLTLVSSNDISIK